MSLLLGVRRRKRNAEKGERFLLRHGRASPAKRGFADREYGCPGQAQA